MGSPVEIFMPVADGSLREYSSIKMKREDVKLVFKQISAALRYLHEKSIVHRDIKPENILYEKRTDGLIFLLTDFGYSTRIHSNTPCIGTKIYFAPEVYSVGKPDSLHDIWSLGVVIFELLKHANFPQAAGLPDDTTRPEEWCSRLAFACRDGGDLARMVVENVQNRASADALLTSSNFPDLPEKEWLSPFDFSKESMGIQEAAS